MGVEDGGMGVEDGGCDLGAFEATPGVIPRLLRLTVSLWTLPSPGWSLEAFFWK